MNKKIKSLFKSLLGPEAESSELKMDAALKQMPEDEPVSAYELEARVLYSATPVEFIDAQPELVDLSDIDASVSPFEVAMASVTLGSLGPESLIISTEGDAVSDVTSWSGDEAVSFTDPNLELGDNTEGTFSAFLELNDFSTDALTLSGLHAVNYSFTLGSGPNSFDLNAGDIVFTVRGNGTLTGNTTSVTASDGIFVFSPEFYNDLNSGEFYYLADNPTGEEIDSLTIVDKPGGINRSDDGSLINQGTFLLAVDNGPGLFGISGVVIDQYEFATVGSGNTTGTVARFLTGFAPTYGIGQKIDALHIVQEATTIGGVTLNEGNLLFSVAAEENVTLSSFTAHEEDIVLLELFLNGGVYDATAATFFDGGDVDLIDIPEESVNALTIRNGAISITDILIDNNDVDENLSTVGGLTIGTLSTNDPSLGPFTYQVLGPSPFSVLGNELILTGETLDFETTPSYQVTVRATGAGSFQLDSELTISVNDLNEAPTVGGPISFSRSEDATGFNVDLLAGSNDVDTSDTLSISNLGVVGDDSGMTVGSTNVIVDPSAYNFLAVGESRVVTYNYDIEDGNGGIVSQTATITITGVNDDPNVGPAIVASANEDAAVFTIDLLVGSDDDDTSDTLSITNLTVVGDDSGITVNPTSIDVDPSAYNYLAVGEAQFITYTYDIVDTNGGTIPQTASITISGVNDDPNVGPAITTTSNEDAAVFTVDLLAGSGDDDTSDTLSITNLTVVGDDSGITVNPTSIEVDPSAYNFLAAGEARIITYSFNIDDGNGGAIPQTATITITGVNDDPNVGPAITASANEDAATFNVDLLTGSGDDDSSDTLSITNLTVVGDDSGMTVNPTSIDVDPSDYNFLAAGEVRIITYSYDIEDGNGGAIPQTATITITGVNDDPSVGPAITASSNEDAATFNVDLLAGSGDDDTTDTLSITNLTVVGDDSGITINPTSIDVDPSAYSSLAVGESRVVTYSYDIDDGNGGTSPQTATITITGVNDDPNVGPAITASSNEGAATFNVDLLAGSNDNDSSDTLSITNLTVVGDDSGMTVSPTSIDVDPSAYNFLAAGEARIITYSFDIDDGSGGTTPQTATITITGVNDDPNVGPAVTATSNENAAVFTVDLLTGSGDDDSSDTLSITNLTVVGDDSGMTVSPTSIDVDPSAYNFLAAGEVRIITYSYDIDDGSGGTIPQTATITITGINDDPNVGPAITVSENEDAAGFNVDLLAGSSDNDTSDTLSITNLSVVGDDSGMSVSPTGINVDPSSYNFLAAGESRFVTYSYELDDGNGGVLPQSATIIITGVNDAPIIGPAITIGTNENAPSLSVDLLAGSSDNDTSDTLSVTNLSVVGDDSGMIVNATSIDIDPSAYNFLLAGDSRVVTYSYDIDDGNGGTLPQTATITINGVGIAPSIALTNTTTSVLENTDTSSRIKVADIEVADDPFGNANLTLSGTDSVKFEIDGTELFISAGTVLDFENGTSLDVTVEIDDPTLGTTDPEDVKEFTVSITDVNEAPTVTLFNTVDTLPEDFDTSTRTKIADILVEDDALGSERLTDEGPDQRLFEIIGTEFFLRAGVDLDFESKPLLEASAQIFDADLGVANQATHEITIVDVNEAPTIELLNTVTDIDENTELLNRLKVADIQISDDALGTGTLTLNGVDANLFEIVGTRLYLKAGTDLDFDTNPVLDVTVEINDPLLGTSFEDSAVHAINVVDIDEVTSVQLTNRVTQINENTTVQTKIADIVVMDALGTETLTLAGQHSSYFEIIGTELFLKANQNIDFESISSLNVAVVVDDPTVGNDDDAKVEHDLDVIDVNEIPSISLTNQVNELPENSDTSVRKRIADIEVQDDALGSENLLLSGTDSNNFEIIGSELFLKAGVVLDHETQTTLDVVVEVDDPSLGSSMGSDDSASHSLVVTDVNEGILVTQTSNVTSESGQNASFEVVLLGPPIGDVVISVASSDLAEGTTSTNQLVFTTENWFEAQTVEVFGVDGFVEDGDQNYSIVLGPAESSDSFYDGLDPDDVDFINLDNDLSGVEVSTTEILTGENGDEDEFSIRLTSRPTDVVTIEFSVSDSAEASLQTNSIVFTPANWNVEQVVTVIGEDDFVVDGNTEFTILATISSTGDENFDSLSDMSISATNVEMVGPIVPEPEPDLPPRNGNRSNVTDVGNNDDDDDSQQTNENVQFIPEVKRNDGVFDRNRTASDFNPIDIDLLTGVDIAEQFSANNYYRDIDPTDSYADVLAEAKRLSNESAQLTRVEQDVELDDLWGELDNLDQRIDDESMLPKIAAGTLASLASVFTAGYLAWLIRGGQIMLGFLSQLPAWTSLDMLAVLSKPEDDLDDEESESLESIVSKPDQSTSQQSPQGESDAATQNKNETTPSVR